MIIGSPGLKIAIEVTPNRDHKYSTIFLFIKPTDICLPKIFNFCKIYFASATTFFSFTQSSKH